MIHDIPFVCNPIGYPNENTKHDFMSTIELGVPDIREADGRNDLFSGDGNASQNEGGKLSAWQWLLCMQMTISENLE